MNEWRTRPLSMLSMRNSLQTRGWKKHSMYMKNEKKARIAIFVSDKIYFKTMTLRDKECQHMVIDPSKMKI